MSHTTTRIDEEAIRAKAYELWQARGCPNGDPGDDWVRAERLLRDEVVADDGRVAQQRETGVTQSSGDEPTLPTGMPAPALETSSSSPGAHRTSPKRRGKRR